MKRRIRAGEHHRHRSANTLDILAECEREGLDWTRRAARLTRRMCEAQTAVIEPDERIVFTRTVQRIPPLYRPEQMERLLAGRVFHELGPINNICADWGMVLGQGLLGRRAVAEAARARLAGDREGRISSTPRSSASTRCWNCPAATPRRLGQRAGTTWSRLCNGARLSRRQFP